jgi:hypothetical protein
MDASLQQVTPHQQAEIADIVARLVPGRSCGSCSMCCKLLTIDEMGKAGGQWCSYAKPGKGCGIHAARPFVCRHFHCHWMMTPGLGPEWKPDVAKFLIAVRNNGTRITAHVDPGSPHAWRREPYYSVFKQWAVKAAAQVPRMHQIDVMIGERLIVILPDRDVEFGLVPEGEKIDIELTKRPDGTIDARAIRPPVETAPAA